jgi:8-oxo-dGTP pyrophosphatase MutT (NUDIX family)
VSASRILSIDALDLGFAARPWPFAETEAARIADHWRARVAQQPRLYNGRVLLLGRHAIGADRRGTTLSGEYFETDFAAFLAWRDFGFPDPTVANAFSMAALVGADGAFLLGEMAAHTANAGATYFPAGTPDPNDVFDGKVDLTASALRELGEETGIAADEVAFAPGWTVVYAPPRIACLKIMRLGEPAEAIKARVDAFLAANANAELTAMRAVHGPADLDRVRAPGFIVDFFDFVFAHKSAG